MWKAILAGVIMAMFLASCTRDKASDNPCGACPSGISFKVVIIPVFEAACATTGCHDAITDTFSLNFDSAHAYASATEPGTGYVIAGNSTGSYLYQVLSAPGANHMPLNAPNLPECEIQEIGCWINQGAQNN
jgi:hypothetical protein